MRNFDPARSFGKRTAEHYDDTLRGDEAETIDFLYEQARGGPVLELAIGTGRIGLRWRNAVWRFTVSSSRPRWWSSSGRSRAVTGFW